jgi:hypothetical protein
MADIGTAAFSVFFMQSPSFLAHQRQLAQRAGHGRSNCETLFGMTKIPSDNHIRDMLDGVAPLAGLPEHAMTISSIMRSIWHRCLSAMLASLVCDTGIRV